MKKTIQILMIIAVAIMAFCFLAMLIVIGLQNILVQAIYSLSEEMMSYFAVPVVSVIYNLLILAATIVLCIMINKRKIGIVFEMIFLVLVVIVMPALSNILRPIETHWILQFTGSAVYAKYSSVVSLCSYATIFNNVGYALSLVACGMSISRKCIKKI